MREETAIATFKTRTLERAVLYSSLGIIFFLAISDAFLNYGLIFEIKALRRIFNIAREGSLASWFSVLQFTAISLAAFLISIKRKANNAKSWIVVSWALVALFFLFLSMDDAAQIHERIGTAAQTYSTKEDTVVSNSLSRALSIFPSYAWQLIVAPLFAIAGACIFVFFIKEYKNPRSKKYVFFAFGLYGLAIALDFVEGIDGGHRVIEQTFALSSYTVQHFAKSIEECIEMCGSTFLLISLLPLLSSFSLTFIEEPDLEPSSNDS